MGEYEDRIEISELGREDAESVIRLAELDTALAPEGRLLGAAVDGRLVAAISLDSGRSVANPFVPSVDALAMLELRVKQLNGRRRLLPRGRRVRGMTRRPVRETGYASVL